MYNFYRNQIDWSEHINGGMLTVFLFIICLIIPAEAAFSSISTFSNLDNKHQDVIQFSRIDKAPNISSTWDNGANTKYTVNVNSQRLSSVKYTADSTNLEEDQPITAANNDENPANFQLEQNHPNPFNPATEISYNLPVTSYVILKVYDMLGRPIKTIVDKKQEAGSYSVQFNASGLTSGMYLYRLKAGDYEQIRKMILIK